MTDRHAPSDLKSQASTNAQRIVIVGAGLAGLRTAEELRRNGYTGGLALIGDEKHLPYDRPPLSKEVLRGGKDDTTLKPLEFFDEQKIELQREVSARSLDITNRTVALSDGSDLSFDELVIATGLRPRNIPTLPDLQGVHVLRTLDESLALRAELNDATKVLIVGAGFIGCEIAASAKLLGLDVVLIEPQSAPLAAVLGDRVGNFVGRLHIDAGVDLRTGVGLESLVGESRVTSALLSDGTRLDVDLVIMGVGSIPATGWLESSGLELDNGIVCDGFGRTSADHIWAVGDVSSWLLCSGERKRHEHWSSAGDQARLLAGALCGTIDPNAAPPVPYFWSDQYDLKIQALGEISATDTVHVVHDDGRKFLAYYERNEILTAVVGAGMPGAVMKTRAKIASGTSIRRMLDAATA